MCVKEDENWPAPFCVEFPFFLSSVLHQDAFYRCLFCPVSRGQWSWGCRKISFRSNEVFGWKAKTNVFSRNCLLPLSRFSIKICIYEFVLQYLTALIFPRNQVSIFSNWRKRRRRPLVPDRFQFYFHLFSICFSWQCDLEDERQVSYQDGKKIAASFFCPFFETSAKNDIGVDEVFTNLARQIKESKAGSTRKAFMRERGRFSLRNMSSRERKCKDRLQALRSSETPSSAPTRRRSGSFRGFICGARTLGTS